MSLGEMLRGPEALLAAAGIFTASILVFADLGKVVILPVVVENARQFASPLLVLLFVLIFLVLRNDIARASRRNIILGIAACAVAGLTLALFVVFYVPQNTIVTDCNTTIDEEIFVVPIFPSADFQRQIGDEDLLALICDTDIRGHDPRIFRITMRAEAGQDTIFLAGAVILAEILLAFAILLAVWLVVSRMPAETIRQEDGG